MFEIMFRSSFPFHWSMCLCLCQSQVVSIIIALYYNVKSGVVGSSEVLLLFRIVSNLKYRPPASKFPGAHLQSLQLQIPFSLGTTMRTSGRKVGYVMAVSKKKIFFEITSLGDVSFCFNSNSLHSIQIADCSHSGYWKWENSRDLIKK